MCWFASPIPRLTIKTPWALAARKKFSAPYPIIPGIDYAGTVEHSESDNFKSGDSVLLTGWGVGEKHSGGFARYARAPAKYLLPLPPGMNAKKAMLCGTAGLTAALCVSALTDSGRLPAGGKVVVSGASGGVGSVAVMLLSRLNYAVSAVSRLSAGDYLHELGATDVITREEMSAQSRPLEKSRWDGAVDCVGGGVLGRILAETNYGGVVAACGLAGDTDLATTVMPFILRGVRLEGVDSVMISLDRRRRAWQLLAETLNDEDYRRINAGNIALSDIPHAADKVLAGESNGRYLVEIGTN